MPAFAVQIVRFVDDSFPGFVECEFIDAKGRVHRIIEKEPVVSAQVLRADNAFPQLGKIACEVGENTRDDAGRALVTVSTARPWGIASTEGQTSFVLLASDILQIED